MHEHPLTTRLEPLRARITDGTRARQLLVTLFADYWLAEGARAPSGALVALMSDFGVSESGTRTLLNRLAREGKVIAVREGRRTTYQLSESSRGRIASGLRRIAAFGDEPAPAHTPSAWTAIAFSVPEHRRADRRRLRTALSWLGFAPLYDGVWVSPRPVAAGAAEAARKLGISAASVFVGTLDGVAPGQGGPISAWDLPMIDDLYGEFLEATDPIRVASGSRDLSPRDALVLRTELINVWRIFPRIDPDLPLSLLPAPWPRDQARSAFAQAYTGLASAALARVLEAVTASVPEYARHVSVHAIDTGLRRHPVVTTTA